MRALTEADRAWLRAEAPRLFGAQVVISRGVAHPVAELDGFLAEGEGLATYRCEGDECELVTIDAFTPLQGVGTRLLQAVEEAARARGCRRLWLITTNDNLEALRFYQRRGYRLSALYAGAVDDVSRLLKPQIPTLGNFGIPLRDELELEKQLG